MSALFIPGLWYDLMATPRPNVHAESETGVIVNGIHVVCDNSTNCYVNIQETEPVVCSYFEPNFNKHWCIDRLC